VLREVLQVFLEILKGSSATITNENISELSHLCIKFVFNDLARAAEAQVCALEE
jgi:hypothetical protein